MGVEVVGARVVGGAVVGEAVALTNFLNQCWQLYDSPVHEESVEPQQLLLSERLLPYRSLPNQASISTPKRPSSPQNRQASLPYISDSWLRARNPGGMVPSRLFVFRSLHRLHQLIIIDINGY